MQIFKLRFLGKLLLFTVLFLVLNQIASYILSPVGAGSELMWYGFNKKEPIDTVFVGDSLCSNALNPEIFDEITGQSSFNMGTNSQSLTCSYLAIKNAIFSKQVKHVVLLLNYPQLRGNIYGSAKSQTAFLEGLNKISNPRQKINNYLYYTGLDKNFIKPVSVNILMPWIYNHVDFTYYSLKKNVIAKFKGKTAYENMNTKRHSYDLNGYEYYPERKIDYDRLRTVFQKPPSKKTVNNESLQWLGSIIELCQSNKVDLLAIYPPHPHFDVLYNGDTHFKMMEQVKTFVTDYNVPFYDFSLIKPEYFDIKDNYFRDREHMTPSGATDFTKAFAHFWLKREKNECMKSYFFTPEEFTHSIDPVSAFRFLNINKTPAIN